MLYDDSNNNFVSIGGIFLNRIHAISKYAKSNWTCSKKRVNVNVSARCTVGWIFEESWPAVRTMWAAAWHSSALPLLHAAKFTRLLSMTPRQCKTLRYISSSREDTFCRDLCYSIVARIILPGVISRESACRNGRTATCDLPYFLCPFHSFAIAKR